MAFNTPYKLFKRYASHEGGIADTAIISWPNGIDAHGEVRDNYVNVCDITPTVYDLLGITPPDTVKGIAQKPLDGMSFKAALDDPKADTGKDTQFYAMLGTRGIWHKGWFANTVHAATPSGWSHFDKDRWELFHIEADRSQCHDLAEKESSKLEELTKLWFDEAAKYNGLPLADLNILETLTRWRPYLAGDRKSFTYYPNTAEVGIGAAVEIRGQSFSVLAEVTVDTTGAEGVIFKQGGAHGGHVLFVQDGRLHYIYNFMGEDEQKVSSSGAVPLGKHIFGVRYTRNGTVEGSHTPLGEVTVYIDERAVGTRPNVKAHPGTFGLAGASLSVGRNTGSAVSSSYKAPYAFTGGTIAAGRRRRLRPAVPGRGEGTGAGVREGLIRWAHADRACRTAWRVFPHGFDELLPGRGAGPHGHGGRVRDRAPPGDQRPVRRIRRRHRLCDGRGAAAGPCAVPRGGRRRPGSRRDGVPAQQRPGRSA